MMWELLPGWQQCLCPNDCLVLESQYFPYIRSHLPCSLLHAQRNKAVNIASTQLSTSWSLYIDGPSAEHIIPNPQRKTDSSSLSPKHTWPKKQETKGKGKNSTQVSSTCGWVQEWGQGNTIGTWTLSLRSWLHSSGLAPLPQRRARQLAGKERKVTEVDGRAGMCRTQSTATGADRVLLRREK